MAWTAYTHGLIFARVYGTCIHTVKDIDTSSTHLQYAWSCSRRICTLGYRAFSEHTIYSMSIIIVSLIDTINVQTRGTMCRNTCTLPACTWLQIHAIHWGRQWLIFTVYNYMLNRSPVLRMKPICMVTIAARTFVELYNYSLQTTVKTTIIMAAYRKVVSTHAPYYLPRE